MNINGSPSELKSGSFSVRFGSGFVSLLSSSISSQSNLTELLLDADHPVVKDVSQSVYCWTLSLLHGQQGV